MKKIGVISTFLLAATAMTLASCGGGQKQKAYVSFAVYGEHVPVFTKAYDGQPAAIDPESVSTNSDAAIQFLWKEYTEDEAGAEVLNNLDEAPTLPGNYFVEAFVPETNKFLAAKTGHDYEITKVALPSTFITWGTLPEVLHFTTSGSGNNTRRTAVPEELATIAASVVVNDGTKTWVAGTDFEVVANIASGRNNPATGTLSISPINNPIYSTSAAGPSIAVAVAS